MPLSSPYEMATLECISTAVFVGTVSIGFASIVAAVLYNMAIVLTYEIHQFPVPAVLYILSVLMGGFFLVESMGFELKEDAEEINDEEGLFSRQEEDPAVLDEDPIAL